MRKDLARLKAILESGRRTQVRKGNIMSKFIYIYNGPATPMDQFTAEQSAAEMAAWGAWMGRVGSALLDGGAPFGARAARLRRRLQRRPQ